MKGNKVAIEREIIFTIEQPIEDSLEQKYVSLDQEIAEINEEDSVLNNINHNLNELSLDESENLVDGENLEEDTSQTPSRELPRPLIILERRGICRQLSVKMEVGS